MTAEIEFTNAKALDKDSIYISGSLDSMPAYSQHTRLFILDFQAKHLWTKHDVEWWNAALEVFVEDEEAEWQLVAMSNEGQVEFTCYSKDPVVEKIPEAGVFSEGAKRWGYTRALRQIGDHLYAVGGAGQVYKRSGPNQWIHMDDGVLQSPEVENRLLLADINGHSENDIYICGGIPGAYGLEGRLYHWAGNQWMPVGLPTTERLTAIYVESASTVWICGANGTLLRGNWKDGFQDLSTVDDNQLFTSIVSFNGMIYLASNLGLFCYDGKRITEVRTGLVPEHQDTNVVDAADGVLWSIGPKDIARYDGNAWARIDHPDNPPIR